MANNKQTHGETTWDSDQNFGGKGGGSNKDLFLHLDNGSNIIRVLTNPFGYTVHQNVKKKGDAGKGQKVPCSATQENGGKCVLCEMKHPNKSRWYFGVLDRKTGAYKVLDVPYMVFGPIRDLNRPPKKEIWGDPTKYDVDITVNKANPSAYYTVTPIPHKPLTAPEQQIRDTADLEYLKKKSEPYSYETVQKIVDKILEGQEVALPEPRDDDKGSKAATTKSNGKGKVAHAPPSATADDGEMDDVFPSYDGQAS